MDLPQFDVHTALEEKHWWFTSRRSLILEILSALIPNNGSVVDVGCGTGANTAEVSKKYTCMGIDPIPEAIASAKSRFPGVTFRTGLAPKDCPEMQSADAVLLLDVLEHIEDDFYFVSELLSQMKPGAYLLMMAPADINLWSTHDHGFDHFRRYSVARFRMLWKDLHVQEALVTHWNTTLYWPIRVVRQVMRSIGVTIGSANTDLHLPAKPINTLLHQIVSRENIKILRALKKSKKGYQHGVSIMSIIQKTKDPVAPRKRPSTLAADLTPWNKT
jgi:2-polyprenyl-3-methyl-5-hydroxy-6-metoxy-1,4-benzoquinol methylase